MGDDCQREYDIRHTTTGCGVAAARDCSLPSAKSARAQSTRFSTSHADAAAVQRPGVDPGETRAQYPYGVHDSITLRGRCMFATRFRESTVCRYQV